MIATLTPFTPSSPPESERASPIAADTAVTAARGGTASTSRATLDDVRIGVRHRISALWIAVLFLYAYGDIFGFFRTGAIKDVMAGKVSGIKITQGFLFGVSVYIAIASGIVFLSLVLSLLTHTFVFFAFLPFLFVPLVFGRRRGW